MTGTFLSGVGVTEFGRHGDTPLADLGIAAARMKEATNRPAVVIGHSAGGAIALNLARRLQPAPAVICLNAALGRFDGAAGWLFPILAKLMDGCGVICGPVIAGCGGGARHLAVLSCFARHPRAKGCCR